MSDIISKITAHYDAIECEPIDVPEWETTIYWKPCTVHDRQQIYKPGPEGRLPDTGIANVRALIRLALDKKGRLLFDEMDEKHLLHHASPAVVERVVNVLMGWGAPAVKPGVALDKAKNA